MTLPSAQEKLEPDIHMKGILVMTSWKTLAGTTGLAAILLAQSAAADVTPEQVWADLKGYMEGYGYQVMSSDSMSGDTLTVSDISMTVPIPEDDTSITLTMPEIVFTGNGGAVDVAWPAEMPVTFLIDEGEVKATLLYETTDLAMTVSGDPGATSWTYSAASTRVSLSDLVVDGETIGRDIGRGELVLTGMSGTSTMATGEMRDIEQSMTFDKMTYDIAARDPDDAESTLLFKGHLDGLTYSSTGSLPLKIDPEDPMALMSVMEMDASFEYGGGSTQFNFVEDDEAVNFASSSTGGTFDMKMNPQAWSYDVLMRGYDVQVQGGEIPFPVALKAGEIGGNIALPVAKTEEPTDVAAGVNLTDFEMNDLIWNIFDPGAQLPRDPATIRIDLTGKARMLFDLFDPAQQEAMAMSDMPAEVHQLSLNTLVIDAVGAMLTGSGAFTFDNSDMQSFPGMPRPQGVLNAELSGANALLDKLVAMGLIPEDQAMAGRMMMGMFAVPAGDDKMTSKIEINEQGHILANGQRIQ